MCSIINRIYIVYNFTVKHNLYHVNTIAKGGKSTQSAMASLFMRFLDHTQRRTTVGRTPLDE